MDDVTALRDALMGLVESIDYCHKTKHLRHADQPKGVRMAGADCYCSVNESMDIARRAIAAVEARAALTPERLAKALHETRGHRDLHPDFRGCSSCSPDAAAIIAALATDEAGS